MFPWSHTNLNLKIKNDKQYLKYFRYGQSKRD